ncbi:MAG: HNH endonuclease [Pseudoalteromonas sp.]|nr:HNH endonuclease [Pseudoalteromonas sp.]
MCKVKGCERASVYIGQDVCQKHYFRFLRNGTYDTVNKKSYRLSNPKGYQLIYKPDHPLSQRNGYIYEHRFVVYSVYGVDIPDCSLCGVACSWELYTTHIDHIDNDVTNNNPSNLRVLCNSCNTGRGKRECYLRSSSTVIEYKGQKKTPTEWSRYELCSVSGSTIRSRIKNGYSAEDAILLPSKTIKRNKELNK